jgi:hypothetical protein
MSIPPVPCVAGAGEGHCDLCYFRETREKCRCNPPIRRCLCQTRNRTRKSLALISVLMILGQDALMRCGSKEMGAEQVT